MLVKNLEGFYLSPNILMVSLLLVMYKRSRNSITKAKLKNPFHQIEFLSWVTCYFLDVQDLVQHAQGLKIRLKWTRTSKYGQLYCSKLIVNVMHHVNACSIIKVAWVAWQHNSPIAHSLHKVWAYSYNYTSMFLLWLCHVLVEQEMQWI